ncbi:CBS domain-containing protein [Bdellovibrio sp. HCB337]|uniref:CBS domain-containing protein n=1 Tax=Bdellovibrio sp. HCB337 TaxID=3394358 RepID=UPI0039A67BF8
MKNGSLQEATVDKFMTVSPQTIGADQTLAKADKLMRQHQIRHLPVLDAGRLVGILSDRDIKLVESFKDVDPEIMTVSEAYTEEPFSVSPKTPLAEVCAKMAQRKYGSVLIVENNKLVGIFTWIDALNAMNSLIDEEKTH